MPEQHRPPRSVAQWRLSNAHDVGQFVRVHCGLCNVRRWYLPADLRQLVGNIDAAALPRLMRCVKCGRRDYLRADYCHLTAQERQTVRIRRLVEIRMVRRVIWRDEGS